MAAEAGSAVVVGRREMRKSKILLVSSFMAAGLVVEAPSCGCMEGEGVQVEVPLSDLAE